MSDQERPPYQQEVEKFFGDEVLVRQQWEGRNTDWLIQQLAWEAENGDGYTPSISLTTAAGVISGTLISRKQYFIELVDQMFIGELDEVALKSKEHYLGFGIPYPGSENSAAQFIHLSNATIFTGTGRIPSDGGVLWRGKISSVIGFSYSGLI